jgi:hypothetical protein
MLAGALLLAACGDGRDATRARPGDEGVPPAPSVPGAPGVPGTGLVPGDARPGGASPEWPADAGAGVNLRREASFPLSGGAAPDQVVVTAQGPRYAALEIRLVIRDAQGDTLWADGWSSSEYLDFVGAAGLTEEEARSRVQAQVDSLLHPSRVRSSGLPRLEQGGVTRERVRESVTYHLAELDWRNRASLRPVEVTPGSAFDRIAPTDVAPERVAVVTEEVLAGPTFRYSAGEGVTYVIGWSVREHAFVRVYSCC